MSYSDSASQLPVGGKSPFQPFVHSDRSRPMSRWPKVLLIVACVFALHWVSLAEQLPPAELGEVMRENHSLLKELRACKDRLAALEKANRGSESQEAKTANRDAQNSQPAESGPVPANEALAA